MKIKSIKLPIYIGNLNIIKLKTKKDLLKLRKKFPKNTPKKFNNYDGFVFSKKGEYYVVFRKTPKLHILSHEVVHLVNQIFIDHQIELDKYNDEPQAYLNGWIYKQIYKYLK